jgi:hypothetical protein
MAQQSQEIYPAILRRSWRDAWGYDGYQVANIGESA